MVMESNGEQHDLPKAVIYDSQEEEDQWPESQSTIHSAAALTDTPKRPPLKAYGRTKRSDKGITDTSPSRSLGASISNAHAEQTLDPICIDSVDGPPQLSPVSTLCHSSKDQPQLSQIGWIGDAYDLESSDDDVPLQPRIPGNERPASVPPVSSATRVDDAQAPPNLPSEDINATEPPRRALRARRPEQQMPYTLDLIRHRDQFRRRGLKPVHNPGEASHTKENDDQYQADEDNSENEPEPEFQSPPGAEEHLPKRRKIRQDNNDDEAQPEIHLRPGRRKFLDPRQFDVSRKVEPPQQDTPEREVSNFDFLSDEDFGFFPIPSPPHLRNSPSPRAPTPQRQFTPTSNSEEVSAPSVEIPITNRPHIPYYISSVSESSESEASSSSDHRPRQRHRSPTSSVSSSSSDADAIELLKKKARGVLPGSFFTVGAKPAAKVHFPQRTATHIQDQERRGVAKTKVNHNSSKPKPVSFPADSSSEDDQVPEARNKRNFVDLTREETIQNDVEGWDIEEDLIDRMLNWGGKTNKRSQKIKSHRKKTRTKTLDSRQKRKRQRRINEFTVPTTTAKSKPSTKTKKTKLSIVDACDMFSVHEGRSPPQFMKIARRQSNAVKNFGRRKAPNRSRFSFAEEEDQEDVNTIIDEWENGTIAEGLEPRPWTKPTRRRASKTRNHVKRTPLAPLREENSTTVENTTQPVDRFLRPGAPIIAIVDGTKSRGRVEQRNTVYPTGEIEGITVKRKPPAAPKRCSRPRRPDDIANWLRNSGQHTELILEDDQYPGEFHDSMDTSTPLPEPRTKTRIRKPPHPRRRDINNFGHRLSRTKVTETNPSKSQQLSLEDVWLPNDPSSLTFDVLSIPEGIFLSSDTFIGRGLLSMTLKTEPAARDDLNLWRTAQSTAVIDVQSACERMGTDLDLILSTLSRLHGLDAECIEAKTIHGQILAYAEFIISSLLSIPHTESNDIQVFGSRFLRLAETTMDHLESTILCRTPDLTNQGDLLVLTVLQTLMVGCYQLCILTSSDISILAADQMMSKLSRRLLKYLLAGGLDALQHLIRRIRARGANNDQMECDSILIDVWSTLYQLLDKKNDMPLSGMPTFWGLLESELDLRGHKDARILDRAWYSIINISTITTINNEGIAQAPSQRVRSGSATTIWNIVEELVTPCLQSYSIQQHYRYDAYLRILFGRCFTLISTWGWCFGAKPILTTMYTFFTERRFDNLKTEGFGGFPKFFQSDTPLEIRATDSTFIIFLKLLVLYITQQQSHFRTISKTDRRQFLAASKDLDRFINRVTPLRTYQSEFSPLDYIALQNHYALLLTLYWVAPGRSRPSIERTRDVIDIEKAPAPAQVICLETWALLTELQLKKEREITSCIDWFMVIFRHSMNEYQLVSRSTDIGGALAVAGHVKPKIRALESILLKALASLENILPLAAEQAAELVQGILNLDKADIDVTGLVVKSSHHLPSSVMRGLLAMLKAFFTAIDKRYPVTQTHPLTSIDQDSQDYGDNSIWDEFLANHDNIEAFQESGTILSKICSHLHQVIANLFVSLKPTADDLGPIIDTWVNGISILVCHEQQDWKTFLEYGGEWQRLRSIKSPISRRWSPYILSNVLSADSNAFRKASDQFISTWFECIVEPEIELQSVFTSILLNLDSEEMILRSPLFIKNSDGLYDITPDTLFETRPALITHVLANMGKSFDDLCQVGESGSIFLCKHRYIDYLYRMLSSMRSIYLEMANTESELLVQYVSLAQHVVGNIIQHCAPFIKESHRTFEDLPILDFFTSGETFPQPGANEITYAGQRLRGCARKDPRRPFSNGTQTDIFWSVKSFLERAVRNNRPRDFVDFCVTAFCEGNEDALGDHVSALRTFVLQDVVCEYFRIAAEAPEITNSAWGYVLPCLAALREVYADIWKGLTRENTAGLRDFVEELSHMMLAMHAMAGVIAYQLDEYMGGPYLAVCLRVFDFVLFVTHVLFFLKDVTHIQAQVFDLTRLAGVFRLMVVGKVPSSADREWIDEIASMRLGKNHFAPTVQREMLLGLPYEVENLTASRMDEIRHNLSGSGPQTGFEEIADMYI